MTNITDTTNLLLPKYDFVFKKNRNYLAPMLSSRGEPASPRDPESFAWDYNNP